MNEKSKRKNEPTIKRKSAILLLIVVASAMFVIGAGVSLLLTAPTVVNDNLTIDVTIYDDFGISATQTNEYATVQREATDIASTIYYATEVAWITQTAYATITPPPSVSAVLSRPSLTPTPRISCFFNWAYGNTDEDARLALQNAMNEAQIHATAEVPAFGEDHVCQNQDTQDVVSSTFHQMDISPEIRLSVTTEQFENTITLQTLLDEVLILIDDTIDARIKRVTVTFATGNNELVWQAEYSEILQMREQETSAEEIFTFGLD